MNLSPLGGASSARPTLGSDESKVAESCRQFEAGLWRSLLEKALAGAAPAGPGRDVYQYFQTSTLADKIAGQPGGLASALQAQLTRTLPISQP